MKKAKRRTFLDRIRNAWRAFCGKPAHSITLALELKRCEECPLWKAKKEDPER